MSIALRPRTVVLGLLAAVSCSFLCLIPATGQSTSAETKPVAVPANGPTAVLGAMSQELELIERELVGKQTHDVCGLKFTTGVLRGREVVLARTGIGKVNAAMTATLLVSTFRPREVVFSGIAGGISESIRPGDQCDAS